MGFIMDGLDAESYDRNYSDRELVRRILRYFKPQQTTMIFVAVMIVLRALMDIMLPVLLAKGIDTLMTPNSQTIIWLLVLHCPVSARRAGGRAKPCRPITMRRYVAQTL